eukprot:6114159-Pleurochrysis_carterae.AAC.2
MSVCGCAFVCICTSARVHSEQCKEGHQRVRRATCCEMNEGMAGILKFARKADSRGHWNDRAT